MNDQHRELFEELMRRGYPEQFGTAVVRELRTDLEARRMLGYLRHYPVLPIEELVDEMLAIAGERERWVAKKQSEHAQQSINEYMERDWN